MKDLIEKHRQECHIPGCHLKEETKMKKPIEEIKDFCKREEGASAVEYGLLVALIAAVIVGAVTFLGSSISRQFNGVATTVNSASSAAAS